MTAQISSVNRVAGRSERCRRTRVAPRMLGKPVDNLYRGFGSRLRQPAVDEDLHSVTSSQDEIGFLHGHRLDTAFYDFSRCKSFFASLSPGFIFRAAWISWMASCLRPCCSRDSPRRQCATARLGASPSGSCVRYLRK